MNHPDLHNEKNLLEQISKGNEPAFEILFSKYYDRLYSYIFDFIKSRQITEEIVMDVFLKIWTGRDIIPQITKFDSFLFRVGHNKAVDFLRSVAKDPKFQDLLWDQIQFSNNDQTDSAIIMQEFENKIREAVSLLSPQRKKVYQLSREEDLTHDQIAVRLHLSKPTINNHIVAAQKFIRDYLSKNSDLACLVILMPSHI